MLTDKIAVSPRVSDLDTQRHVTSRTYEAFCWQARYKLLADQGYSTDRLLEEQILLVPTRSFVRFTKEQLPGAQLFVKTRVLSGAANQLIWDQEIIEADSGKLAVRILTETRATKMGLDYKWDFSVSEDESLASEDLELLDTPAPYSGNCKQVISPAVMNFSERTIFFDYPPHALWRVMEEGRWFFSDTVGLDQELILALDTVTFFTSATFQFLKMPVAGQELTIRTWVEKIDRIRLFMRQDVTPKDSDEVLFSIREEQLIVSLSRRRPRKAPPEFLDIVGDYMPNTALEV